MVDGGPPSPSPPCVAQPRIGEPCEQSLQPQLIAAVSVERRQFPSPAGEDRKLSARQGSQPPAAVRLRRVHGETGRLSQRVAACVADRSAVHREGGRGCESVGDEHPQQPLDGTERARGVERL